LTGSEVQFLERYRAVRMNELQGDLETELKELVELQMEAIIAKYGSFYGTRKHKQKARKLSELLYRRKNLLTDKDMEIEI
jgi:hypothetical protein